MAAGDDEVNIKFGATIDELVSKLALIGELFKGVAQGAKAELQDQVGGVFQRLGEKARALGDVFTSVFSANILASFATRAIDAILSIPGAMVDAVRSVIDAADHLNDLSQKTGIAVEVLGGLGFAATQAGGTLDSAATAIGKLNKTIAEAAAGSKTALAPFQAIGVEVTDAAGKTKAADVVFAEIANKFQTYNDGPEKAALAMRLFGKAGADLIPLLNEGGQALLENVEYYKRYGGITTDTAQRADAFNDTLGKLSLIGGAFTRTLASELLPALQAVADEILHAREESDLFRVAADALRTVFETIAIIGVNVAFVFGGVGRELGAIAAQIAALARGDFAGFSAISDAVKADGVKARAELDAVERRILGLASVSPGETAKQALHAGEGKAAKSDAPGIERAAKKGKTDRSEEKTEAGLLAWDKAELEAGLAQQKEALKEESALFDDAYKQNLLTIREFYDGKLAIERAGFQASLETKRAELAQAEAAGQKASDRNDAPAYLKYMTQAAKLQGEINVLTAQEAEAVRANTSAREDAERKLADELAAMRAQRAKAVAEDEISVDKAALAQKKALLQISAAEAFEVEKQLEARSYTATQAALQAKAALIHGDNEKAMKEREALNAEMEAAERQHQQKVTAIDNQAELERRKYSIEAQRSIQGSFASMIGSLLNGTARIGEALRNFARSVATTFGDLIAKKFTEKLFDASGVGKMIDRMVTFLVEGIGKMIGQWFSFETAKTAASTAGAATREGVEVASAATSKSVTAGSAIANIGAKAWEAAASVYASIASIPVVGPFLAPAMAVAAGAMVLGFVSRIASSEGGEYRVDQDRLNYVHKDETILPAPFAEGLRNLIDAGGPALQVDGRALPTSIPEAAGQAPGATAAWRLPANPLTRIQNATAPATAPAAAATGAGGRGGARAAPVQLVGTSAGDFFIANKRHLLRVLGVAARDLDKPS